MTRTGELQERSRVLGARMLARLRATPSLPAIREARGIGLWAGVEFASLPGREVCERLAARGVLAKETHGNVIRLAPPLIISEEDLDWGLAQIEDAIRPRGPSNSFSPLRSPGGGSGPRSAPAGRGPAGLPGCPRPSPGRR